MKIFISEYSKPNQILLDVEPNDTILEVKQKLYEKQNSYPIDYFTFIFAGTYLKDNVTLKAYNIQPESKIFQHVPCKCCRSEAINKGNITDIESQLKGEKGVFLIIKCKCSDKDYCIHLNLEINKEYDIKDICPLKCTSCGKKIKPLNIRSVGFYQCACDFYNYLFKIVIETDNKDEYKYKNNTQGIFKLKLLEIFEDLFVS